VEASNKKEGLVAFIKATALDEPVNSSAGQPVTGDGLILLLAQQTNKE
jgi:hypothetical protein